MFSSLARLALPLVLLVGLTAVAQPQEALRGLEMKRRRVVLSEATSGKPVNTLLTVARARGCYFSEAFTLYMGAEVAATLAYAHQRTDDAGISLGIVTRDVNCVYRTMVSTDSGPR
ncbi:hypothetical protein MYXA107069_23510 [Myxococcus xanthus]|uniref:hypothetical protein n=1 Tax=Myxococcus TaxID=32 RepID=UPI00068A843A|nr:MULTISPECIES: hypothetical protein [Myxococcus]QPM81708.1 hypothetical protein I5Q59_10755 [Myxococcus xanthus]QZZ49893.1 hypothetical protein MyxoNM_11865 [Myxococcus xanthus]SDY23696.1 hypothetical protein SAMN05444383_12639 [Myxococcus xanthus]